ncbi:DUF3307 domain-containing protein [Halomonas korlensis]|uniref:DUF3307 domain-containing protein n=1 Tax=Halomonas korlensis TaxID=463301 RepID=A0A1I7KAT3_9GAMM|nr:DUF3307 domain-containing protein [Halomonas korlensis]SFU94531.1 Protein of unknown function [Halomonas korlensis]
MNAADLSLLFGLVLAHLVGDFVLQPGGWVEERYRLKQRSRKLAQHALVHGLLAAGVLMIAVLNAPTRGPFAILLASLALAASHWLIDVAKAHVNPQQLRWFLLDQALHLLVIVTLWLSWIASGQPLVVATVWLMTPQILGLATAYLLVTRPMSIAIALVMRRWNHQLEDTGTLADAGARIGMLERFLVLTLVLLDQLIAVGFLLAAKSVLRFGDLREAQDRKLTEYVLLGTLLSVSATLILGMCVRQLLE